MNLQRNSRFRHGFPFKVSSFYRVYLFAWVGYKTLLPLMILITITTNAITRRM
jgi:Ni/Fe-hydrogenase subunit HybB-like protein